MSGGNIETTEDFDLVLRRGRYIDGGYPIFFLCDDGGILSFDAARDEAKNIRAAIRGETRDRCWRVVAYDVNWEDAALYCDHTGKRIESAYAEDEAGGDRE